MTIPIINYSALEFWLDGTNKNDFASKIESVNLSPRFPFEITNHLAENLAQEYSLSMPINLMVPEKQRRCCNNSYHLFSFPSSLPPNSFVELLDHFSETLFVSAPEYCFLFAASRLPFHEVVRIGCMLCALYVNDKTQSMQQRSRTPITNKKKIQRYLKKAHGVRGVKTACAAIRYVVDGCNSPMEVSLAVLACLPFFRGGYALDIPDMNKALYLSSVAKRQTGIQTLRGDMVWSDCKLVVEYDSNLSHLQKEQHEYDKRRASAIALSGYQLISLTAGQLKSFSNVEESFCTIRRQLGIKNRPSQMNRYEDLRWEVVHEILLKKKTIQQILFGPGGR